MGCGGTSVGPLANYRRIGERVQFFVCLCGDIYVRFRQTPCTKGSFTVNFTVNPDLQNASTYISTHFEIS